jgi:hypothetical protein
MERLKKEAIDALDNLFDMSDQVPRFTFSYEYLRAIEQNLERFKKPELENMIASAESYCDAAAELENAFGTLSFIYQIMRRLSEPDGEEDDNGIG